jgi:hypothetical protein
MTAGNGILHQEMPQEYRGNFQGFQLWVNLPSASKMMDPRYRGITKAQIPVFSDNKGVDVKVIAGRVEGVKGPVKDLVVETEYLDVSLGAGKTFSRSTPGGNTVVAYVFEGGGFFEPESPTNVLAENVVVYDAGDEVNIRAGPDGLRFLLACAKPLKEPVAWGGPIVMNSREELDVAFRELREGTFIKRRYASR